MNKEELPIPLLHPNSCNPINEENYPLQKR